MTETSSIEKKAVIVISPKLGVGQATNRAAVLATGLMAHNPEMKGADLITKDKIVIPGFTQMPIPILVSKPNESLLEFVKKSKDLDVLTFIFLSRAQGMSSYEEYKESVTKTDFKDLDIDAVAIFGNKKTVNKLTGNLAMLR